MVLLYGFVNAGVSTFTDFVFLPYLDTRLSCFWLISLIVGKFFGDLIVIVCAV